MTTPPFVSLTWTDHVTGRQGFLVVDRLVRGVSSGGLRMRPGCTLDEVAGLARGMTMKEALHYDPASRYVPLGGAKGGIDFDPRDPGAYGVLVRYLRAMRPYIEHFWTTGEDLGLTQDLMDRAAAEAGLVSTIQAVYPLLDDESAARRRLADAFAVQVDGIGLDELVGGCGVAESVLTALDRAAAPYAGTRVAVQGLGTMGGATARFLARAGLTVVAVADIKGTLTNPAGLDVEALLAARDPYGTVDRSALRPEDREAPADAWLAAEADVLVPAAVSYAIDAVNEHRVTARLIVEAANMPVLPAAEDALARRGVTVLPDVVVNSGTNAWWWWTLFGDVGPTADEAFAHVRRSMRALVDLMLTRAGADGTTPRAAAHAIAADRVPAITERFGRHR
ncbi:MULTISPECIES: Glu/Leu/Phe/Val dehydrogenase dimerization domain-containing protein [Streptomyces]|uniref:Glutamate dehydrogenase n=1 Tax=Streptomyces scabiei (strain 87.22) TaxID=680198 RepID=C9Z6P4_STRSW|nr:MULTISPECIES: Glu/Leu/Phe/Val dehydrogenase dimerization domain-containing protein [Streptomyces]MBP5859981.1 glutamate dehydrogenase [Streptomyces sp. LBUM 1484]MBP5871302.1 glutamate dehydrogenase [Streptomyces sp. LBUM 1485]KFG07977.1 glutamate dehydrogenase [Streptomyces scabiei]MBP5887563.1 glutamate dehydrogenase [Streptomyces sp. LBUM 1487]MBP5903564.1 glutamate dehydrogenase [Streptomyces sp. LBUM 1488]